MPAELPTLPKGHKGRYPFRLACPSFVYPAGYIENVARLAPFVDEIELLCLEGAATSRPDAALIAALKRLGEEQAVSYNVHLPIDVRLGDASSARRQAALRALEAVMRATRPLNPTCWVLHLHPGPESATPAAVTRWQERLSKVLPALLAYCQQPRQLALENLDYPFAWILPLAQALDLGLCIDIGHALMRREPLMGLLDGAQAQLAMLHIHGVRHGRDHRPLAELPPAVQTRLRNLLQGFRGGVVVEVFDFDGLRDSLEVLARWLPAAHAAAAAAGVASNTPGCG